MEIRKSVTVSCMQPNIVFLIGDPAILHQIITNENLDIEDLNNVSFENLTVIARRCKIKTSGKSKVYLIYLDSV
jgi:hypothetical protein